ncbi:MAG: hypothetical protein FE78DRAFT_248980 [Acidomyces sp. 'richmondensis']|nr:MAG: hypothetical protein FE78DRAFT_248980 [Acidomyces sp. 'richmondensis']
MLTTAVTAQPEKRLNCFLQEGEEHSGYTVDTITSTNEAHELLFREEDSAEGRVNAEVYRQYVQFAGGRLLLFSLMAALGISFCLHVLNQYWFILRLDNSLKLSPSPYMAGYIVLTVTQAASSSRILCMQP